MRNLFGQQVDRRNRFTVFQDESWCSKSKFLYHGYLFVEDSSGREVLDNLLNIKSSHGRGGREIHFRELIEHPDSPPPVDGTKTRVALDWLSYSRKALQKGKLKFYAFGINGNNVRNFWENENRFEKNVYLRFFAMGLKSSIRWFRIPRISHTFLDRGRYDAERRRRVQWLDYNFFKLNFPNRLDWQKTQAISSDEKESASEISNFIQLTDVLIGTVRSSFIESGKNQKGQECCVDNFIDVVRRFNKKEGAYRTGSSFYKKFCIQFFPRTKGLTKKEFLEKPLSYHLKMNAAFYCDRLTFGEQQARKTQLELL